MWLRTPCVQRFLGGGILERTAIGFVSQLELLGLGGHKESKVLRLIRGVRPNRRGRV